jgi:Aspartyl protease
MAAPFNMPMRNERAAPTFDSKKPREFARFFRDLEKLMARANITLDSEKKDQVLEYVDFDTEQIWKTFPEFTDILKSYDQFKAAIFVHYPDATGDFIYSLKDMDLLIGQRQRLGLATMQDLSEYHLQFLGITRWLINKGHLADLEQQRAFIRAFQPQFLALVMNRLTIKKPDHHPDIPYKIEDVYEAARFVLQGASVNAYVPATSTPIPASAPSTSPSSSDYIKTETFTSMMAEFTKTMTEALSGSRSRGFTRAQQEPNQPVECNYCGGPHYIRDCECVEEDIKGGKCRRNQEGKVVLPTGAYVSRTVPGKWMRDRINEWHRQHPNQLAAATLIHTIDARLVYPLPSTPSNQLTGPTNSTYQLNTNDRIAVLEAELFSLKTKKTTTDQAPRTRAQRSRAVTIEDEDDEADVAAARAKLSQSRIEEVDEEPRAQTPISSAPAIAPEHPFRNAKDAAYTPPSSKNIGAQDKVSNANKRTEPAYKTLPPVHDPAIAVNVFQRSMETPITITQRELLSLSPEVRSQVRDTTITRRIPNKDTPTPQNLYQGQEYEFDDVATTFPITGYPVADAYNRPIPQGAVIVPDPVESYYRSLGPGEEANLGHLIVSSDSCAVRSVHAQIDNSHRVECILDPGCSIIAMSRDICHELGLAHDPSIILQMESANGGLDLSLGLARNVPFQIGSLTMYLQVHVISSPAYDVLLGRPFDVLTESVVRNFANEDQTITLHDPNTGRRVTVPTVPRSRKAPTCTHPRHNELKRLNHKRQGF